MPRLWEALVERNLDLVVRGMERARVVGAATARRGANRTARLEVRMPRPTRPVALERDCLVILNGVSGAIGFERKTLNSGDAAER